MRREIVQSVSRAVFLVLCLWGGLSSAQTVPSNSAFNLSNYAGKVVYVDFWASWCRPCLESFPFMADMSRQFGDELAIVAINVDEDKNDALRFLEIFEAPFEIVYDPQGELASGFDIPGMPTSYLFDREGNLLMRHVAFKRSHIDTLQQAIKSAVELP